MKARVAYLRRGAVERETVAVPGAVVREVGPTPAVAVVVVPGPVVAAPGMAVVGEGYPRRAAGEATVVGSRVG